MNIFYDWEFLEDGSTIAPISVGMVAEDGREFYAVFDDIDKQPLRDRICANQWLVDNVVCHLPLKPRTRAAAANLSIASRGGFYLDDTSNVVMPKRMIRNAVREFLTASAPVELWGYYAAYDHVALAQLFGPMISRPPAMPMFTHDLMQLLAQVGATKADLPPDPVDAHNALADARWTRDAHAALIKVAG